MRDPRRHITLERNEAKLVLYCSQLVTVEYGISHLPAKHDVRCLNVVFDAGPNPLERKK